MSLRTVLAAVMFVALAAASGRGDEKKPAGDKPAAFEKFKSLAGEWVGKQKGGEKKGIDEVRVKYKLTSGGSTVVETIFPDSEMEMVTVIHPDGDQVLLTHYCMLGNQPQMKTPGKYDGSKVAFEFVKATNLKSDKDMHMHDVTYTFVDDDTFRTEWTHCHEGKCGGKVVFEFKRKK